MHRRFLTLTAFSSSKVANMGNVNGICCFIRHYYGLRASVFEIASHLQPQPLGLLSKFNIPRFQIDGAVQRDVLETMMSTIVVMIVHGFFHSHSLVRVILRRHKAIESEKKKFEENREPYPSAVCLEKKCVK